MAKEEHAVVLITATNKKEAKTIRDILLKERLAACVSMFPVESKWWWKGKLEECGEVYMFVKTKTGLVDDIIREVKTIHAYEVPCILVLPVVKGNPGYLEWLDEVVK